MTNTNELKINNLEKALEDERAKREGSNFTLAFFGVLITIFLIVILLYRTDRPKLEHPDDGYGASDVGDGAGSGSSPWDR